MRTYMFVCVYTLLLHTDREMSRQVCSRAKETQIHASKKTQIHASKETQIHASKETQIMTKPYAPDATW
jgi:hypothetical protein